MNTLKIRIWAAATVLTAMSVVGCAEQAPPQQSGSKTAAEHGHEHGPGGHEHAHAPGPHGGTVADWGGGKFHVELTVDHDKQQATVYVLGSDEETPIPIDAESILLTIRDPQLQADLKPMPLEGEVEGKSSRFIGTHEGLATVKDYAGTISGVVGDTPYAGNFDESQSTHGHSHSGDDALVWEGEPRQHSGLTIKLGHHGNHLRSGENVEPAVSITRGSDPVEDARVFNSLVSADGSVTLAEEVPTVFEPATDEEPAHYAQGVLLIPENAKSVAIRFRIVVADDEATFVVPITVE